ncbi:sigma-54-dependent transcriptional regulator [Desulfovibrio aminophilus]|uniref:sigma-54-dependent transcriptional regulator n=1 Tax=Desulfovibrio aminophilus TaxID=81425 RepID=UPI00040181DA|nr:sigma-54 dependent transcriptional regulator [Desulfovibrio aminophilus]
MNILIIDDDADVRATMESLVRRMDLACDTAAGLGEGLAKARCGGYDVVFLDVRLPDGNGLDALPVIKSLPDSPEVIILTGLGDPDGAELAIQGGVWDYLVKPAPVRETMLSLKRALQYRQEKNRAKGPRPIQLSSLVGTSSRMRQCFDLAAQAAASQAAVLITGETGTGKELFARAIHDNSSRAGGSFVVVDCATLTESLVEGTLLGHRKGAFTGADCDRDGLVRLADGGTLFLDEVGELPLSIQKSFLRVLQEKRFRPVGASREVTSDFRLIAATNRNLEEMVERGAFRQDLLFRIKTVHMTLPPLRERIEDVGLLAARRLEALAADNGRPPKVMDSEFSQIIAAYSWPGNVRELYNVMERAVIAAGDEPTLFALHLPQEVRIAVTRAQLSRGASGEVVFSTEGGLPTLRAFKEAREREYLELLRRECGGEIVRMLDVSGLSRSHLYALLKKYGVDI